MVKGKKMRYNPYWYQGLDFVEEDPKFSNVDEDINMNGHAIINLKYPANENDAASKKYVDDAIAAGGGGPGGGPLLASQIQSVATAQIQALNVQEAINEISAEGAFLDSPNVFSQVNTFNQVPKLAAGVNVPSTDPQALTTVAKVNSLIAAIKAAGVAVDQSTPLTNLTGPDVQAVIKQTDTILSQLKSNLHLVGTYDVAQDKVLEAFGTAGSGNITANAVLPVPSADNKNMYLLVKVGGTGSGNAIAVQFDPGDIIYSSGTSWRRAFTAISRAPLNAANISSVATQQIKGTNVQAVIDELSTRAAFKDLDNTFTKVVKLAPGVTPTDPQDLATVAKVDAALGALKASGITVDPAVPPLNNLTGANVQEVIEQADDLFDELSEIIVANTSLVGLYNAANNTVTKRFIGDIGGQPAGGITEGQALPAADDTNKNMYLYVHEEGTGAGEAPSGPLKVGDLVISDGARWNKVSLSKVINASQVSVTAIAGVAGANVQEVLQSLNNADKIKTTFVGTYNATTNKIAFVNASIATAFPEYVVGQDLPAHNAKFINHILYVTTAGTGAAPLPTEAMRIGDMIHNLGTGWEIVSLTTEIVASNVGVTQIPGATGANVQEVLESLQTGKAEDDQVVKLTGNQVVAGQKTFTDPTFTPTNGEHFSLLGDRNQNAFFDWRDNTGRYAYMGFGSSRRGSLQFVIDLPASTNPVFEFNKVCRYEPGQTVAHDNDLVHKGYADNAYVSRTANQEVEGSKRFQSPIQVNGVDFPQSITGNRPGSRFDFLSGDLVKDAQGNVIRNDAPVKQNLIEFPRGANLTRVSGFQFSQIAERPRGNVHFVLKYYNADIETLFYRLSFRPGEAGVKCYVQGNKLTYKSSKGHGEETATNNGVVLDGVANATADMHALNRRSGDARYVQVGNVNQTIQGVKTFATQIKAGSGGGHLKLTPEDNSTKTLFFSDSTIGANNKFNLDLERKSKLTGLVDPVADYDAVTKSYVDTKGNDYVTKTNGQLITDLDAAQQKIVNLGNPVSGQDAVNLRYAEDTYVKKTGGQLTGPLDANNQKITNLDTPTANNDAVNMIYVTNTVANYVKKSGGELTGNLDAGTHKINRLGDGAAPDDAINKGQLDAAINGLQSQLTGKLTFVGTYNAQNNTVDTVNSAINAQFPEYTAGSALPQDAAKFANNFLIVTTAGTGTAPAPTIAMNIGDLIYSSGSGWGHVPLGTTVVASNVGLDPIQQLPGVSNVQVALETIASRPAGAATATTTTFNPAGGIVATNVQAAIEELDTKKAANDQVVKLTGDQTVSGSKTFDNLKLGGSGGIAYAIVGSREAARYFEWRHEANSGRYAYVGFASSSGGSRGVFSFAIEKRLSGNDNRFEFNSPIRYTGTPNITDDKDVISRGYANSNYVRTGDYSQSIGGTKMFNNNIRLRLNEMHAKFNFLNTQGSAHVVRGSFIEVQRGAYQNDNSGEMTRVMGFSYAQQYLNTQGNPLSSMHFALKYDSPATGELFWYRLSALPNTGHVHCYVRRNQLQFHSTKDDGSPTADEKGVVLSGLAAPTQDSHAANKKYVDDAVANVSVTTAPLIERIQDVDVTAASASLAGKGTMTCSYRLTRDPDTRDVLSALFGMKLTLTAPWNPGEDTTPVELPGCQIAGEEYFKGLPIPVDTTLQGGSFKTVAQIGLIRVVPNGGVNLPQADAPLMIGRIVCAIDGGNTKLYAVFKHNADVAVPQGTGAFFVVRYEGLPTLAI